MGDDRPVKISSELFSKVQELAERKGVTIKAVVEEALSNYLGVLQMKTLKTLKRWKTGGYSSILRVKSARATSRLESMPLE